MGEQVEVKEYQVEAEGVKPKRPRGRPKKIRRKERKRRPRKTNALRHSVLSRAAKKRCQDPEFRRKNLEALKRAREARKKNGPPRLGVPDGWTRETASAQRIKDAERAEAIIAKLIEQGMVDAINPDEYEKIVVKVGDKEHTVLVPKTDDAKAVTALREAMVHAISPLTGAKERPAYVRMVLDFTKKKPATDSNVNVGAEDWLTNALKDNAQTNDDDKSGADSAP